MGARPLSHVELMLWVRGVTHAMVTCTSSIAASLRSSESSKQPLKPELQSMAEVAVLKVSQYSDCELAFFAWNFGNLLYMLFVC
jgi:hypothetical protein